MFISNFLNFYQHIRLATGLLVAMVLFEFSAYAQTNGQYCYQNLSNSGEIELCELDKSGSILECVGELVAPTGETFSFNQQMVALFKAQLESQNDDYSLAMEKYQNALFERVLAQITAGIFGAAGTGLVIGQPSMFFGSSQSMLEGSQVATKAVSTKNTVASDELTEVVAHLKKAGLSLDDPMKPSVSSMEVVSQGGVFSDEFVSYFSQKVQSSLDSAGKKAVGHTISIDNALSLPYVYENQITDLNYHQIVQDFISEGHKAEDIIRPVFWDRLIEFQRIEYLLEGPYAGSSADLAEAFVIDGKRTLAMVNSFVDFKGVPPSYRTNVRMAQRIMARTKMAASGAEVTTQVAKAAPRLSKIVKASGKIGVLVASVIGIGGSLIHLTNQGVIDTEKRLSSSKTDFDLFNQLDPSVTVGSSLASCP